MELTLCIKCAALIQEAYHLREIQFEGLAWCKCDHCRQIHCIRKYEVKKIERNTTVSDTNRSDYYEKV